MASAREKLSQLGLWDDEVPKLSHDAIVLWAYENAQHLVQSYLTTFPKRDYNNPFSEQWSASVIVNNSGIPLKDLPPLPEKPVRLHGRKTIEQVIEQYPEHANGRSLPRILGYGDLLLTWSAPRVEWDNEQWHVSFRDAGRLLIEAKTVMPSLGELMRQLNLYRLVYPDVVVVSPDASYQELLFDQGVHFIPYRMDI